MIETQSLWTYDMDQATRLQDTLRQRLVLSWDGRPVKTIAGIDASYSGNMIYAAIAVFSYPELTRLHTVTGEAPQDFPYIPGLLAYRVGPAILDAWEKLGERPDVLLIHGHGIAHPRGMGLAAHIGLWVNKPSIGIAKTILFGCQSEPGLQVGDWTTLLDEQDASHTVGATLRTCSRARPVYVSPGHLIDVENSIKFVLATTRGCRMPEPIRVAHQAATQSQHR
jgi:deoxyribonuclease V